MARPTRLEDDVLTSALATLDGWTLLPDRPAIRKSYRFADFSEAFGWMTRAALLAEKLDHHPEWTNVWNRVDVVLTTHDAGGLTTLDVLLAEGLDRLHGSRR